MGAAVRRPLQGGLGRGRWLRNPAGLPPPETRPRGLVTVAEGGSVLDYLLEQCGRGLRPARTPATRPVSGGGWVGQLPVCRYGGGPACVGGTAGPPCPGRTPRELRS